MLGGIGSPADDHGFGRFVLGGCEVGGLYGQDALGAEAYPQFVNVKFSAVGVEVNVLVAGPVDAEFGLSDGVRVVGRLAKLRIDPDRDLEGAVVLEVVAQEHKVRLVGRGMNFPIRVVGVDGIEVVVGDAGVVAEELQVNSAMSVRKRLQEERYPDRGLAVMLITDALGLRLIRHAGVVDSIAVELKAARRGGELIYAVRVFERFRASHIGVHSVRSPAVVPALASRLEVEALAGGIVEALVSPFAVGVGGQDAVGLGDLPDLVPGQRIVPGLIADHGALEGHVGGGEIVAAMIIALVVGHDRAVMLVVGGAGEVVAQRVAENAAGFRSGRAFLLVGVVAADIVAHLVDPGGAGHLQDADKVVA